jgi:hypothetical protein
LKAKPREKAMEKEVALIMDLQFLCDVGKIGSVQGCVSFDEKNDGDANLSVCTLPDISPGIMISSACAREASTKLQIQPQSVLPTMIIGVLRSVDITNIIHSIYRLRLVL